MSIERIQSIALSKTITAKTPQRAASLFQMNRVFESGTLRTAEPRIPSATVWAAGETHCGMSHKGQQILFHVGSGVAAELKVVNL